MISPFSVQNGLIQTTVGTAGVTEEELKTGLGFDSVGYVRFVGGFLGQPEMTGKELKKRFNFDTTEVSKYVIADVFGSRWRELNYVSDAKFAIKMYVMSGYDLKHNTTEIMKTRYCVSVDSLDFAKSQEAATAINNYIKSKTLNNITDIVTPDMFSSETKIVLVSAIHFKGSFKYQFKPEATIKAQFWINQTQAVEADMMNLCEKLKYTALDELDAKAVILPFKDYDCHMIVFVPNERDGLEKMEKKLRHLNLNDFEKNTSFSEVTLALPKFKIEFFTSIKDNLKEMGMTSMFDQTTADFSDLLEQKQQISISDVFHKASIEVGEDGADEVTSTATGKNQYLFKALLHKFKNFHSLLFRSKELFLVAAQTSKFDSKSSFLVCRGNRIK